jgi:mannose-6-phosphate isomerase-like protein (cupin superfamily)
VAEVKVKAKHSIIIWLGESKFELQPGEVLEVPEEAGRRLLASGKLSKHLEEVAE